MKLTTPLSSSIVWDGRRIPLNLSYDTVLMVYEVWQDGAFTDADKVDICLGLLVTGWRGNRLIEACKWRERVDMLSSIFREHINTEQKTGAKKERTFDFTQDAEYIFASFFMDYGIDLIQEQGRLDWRKFIALFSGLSDKTKMREVIAVRSRPMPKPTQHNAAEITALKEAKEYYALKTPFTEKEENFCDGLSQLFKILKARATSE